MFVFFNVRFVFCFCLIVLCHEGLGQEDKELVAGAPPKIFEGVIKYDNGQIKEQYGYKAWRIRNDYHHLKHGPYVSYKENGRLDVRCTYVDGKLNGLWEHINYSGLKEEKRYINGKMTWTAIYYENGQLANESYCNDPDSSDLDGPSLTYYENGQLKSKGQYLKGNLSGTLEAYHPDGKLASRKSYKFIGGGYNSEVHGVSTEWYESGQKKQIRISCAGREYPNGAWSTRWKTWDQNGKVTYQIPAEVIKEIPCWDEIKDELEEVEFFEIKVLVEAPGHDPVKDSVFCKTHEPSQILLEGIVLDQDKNPVSGAVVSLVGFKQQTTTNASGQYRIEAQAQGAKPFSASLPITMNRLSQAGNITIKCGDVIPVPGTFPLTIKAIGQDGQPIKGARVSVSVESNQPLSFLYPTEQPNFLTDSQGGATIGLTCRTPGTMDYTSLEELPLVAKLVCRVEDIRSRKLLAEASITRPFNMSRIHGVTVGPDMTGRSEGQAPLLGTLAPFEEGGFSAPLAKSLLLDRDNNSQGDFWLLVHPLNPKTMTPIKQDLWKLDWTGMARLPMAYHLKKSPKVGEQLELGKIDLLSPDEHEQRFRKIVEQFIQAMPLTATAKASALKGLPNVKWTYNASGEVPVFQDNMLEYGGNIATPGKPDQYWGRNPVRTDDAAYVIMLHELGHFLHHTLVERHFYMNCLYNKIATGDHKTWVSLQKDLVRGMHLSFTESQADFFAVLAQNFWASTQPEIIDSVYFKNKQYLPQFENDDRAMQALNNGEHGYLVEGIQTRFLTAYYQSRVQTEPVWVYSDYLKTMLEYGTVSREVAIMQRPARTMRSWIYTKYKVHGEESIYGLASRYRLLFGDPEATLMPTHPTQNNRVLIQGKLVDFKLFPVARVPFGSEIEVLEGTMDIDLSSQKQRRTLFLSPGTKITLKSREEVAVHSGLIGADYSVLLITPQATVKPKGTVVTVEVKPDGSTEIKTLEGVAEIHLSNRQEPDLIAGQSVDISPEGVPGEIKSFDTTAALNQFSAPFDMPFNLDEMSKPGKGDWLGDLKNKLPKVPPMWYVLGALVVIPVVLILLFAMGAGMWYLRRFFVAIPLGMILFFSFVFIFHLFFDFQSDVSQESNSGILLLSVKPYSAWSENQDWIPMSAWILSCLVIGAVARGGIRGMFACIIFIVIIWAIAYPQAMFFEWTKGQAWMDLGKGFYQDRLPDLVTMFLIACVGGGLSGYVFRKPSTDSSKMGSVQEPKRS